ncbi:MAG: GtrA family protein, partial [Solirubrobacteraceae bacterium]
APDARREEMTRVVTFICVGCAGTAFALALFAVFHELLGIDYRVSAALGVGLSFAANFFVNRRWTFKAHGGPMGPQAIRFATVSTVATVANVIIVHVLHESAHIAEFPAEAIAVVAATPVSYLGNRWWTFEGARRPVGDLEAA